MKVTFAEISKSGVAKRVEDRGWSAGAEAHFVEFPVVEVFLTAIDDVTVTLEGSLKAKIDSLCSRCGRSLEVSLDTAFHYIFRLGVDLSVFQSEVECSDEDCNTVYLDEPVIELEDIAQEQLILALPQKLLCKKDCKGLCYRCGARLDTEKCHCPEDVSDSPFAVLGKLKK